MEKNGRAKDIVKHFFGPIPRRRRWDPSAPIFVMGGGSYSVWPRTIRVGTW